jgi:PHD and RING finger domain-containing protein 1
MEDVICLIQVCGGCDREDRMLLCDGCHRGYHLECLDPPRDTMPLEDWFCLDCAFNNSVHLAEEVAAVSQYLYHLFSGSYLPF